MAPQRDQYMRMLGFCRGLFASASASLAILSLAYGEFAPGARSLPAWIPWPETWIHGAALLVLAASVGILFARTVLTSALTIGVYAAVWALIAASRILHEPLSIGAWYPFSEALTAVVGAWILCALLRRPSGTSDMTTASERTMRVAQALFGLTCVFYGASHFVYANYTASMVPAWLPGPLGLAYFTGLAHIAAGIGITVGVLPRVAAILEATMMSLFGLMVWVPSFFAQPRPIWATPPHNQWSELVVNLVLAACAWIVAASLKPLPALSNSPR